MPRRSAEAALMPARVDGQPAPLRPRHDLDAEVRRVFAELTLSVPPSHFRPGDLPLLEAYCETTALARQAAAGLRADGVVSDGKPSPWLAVLDRAHRALVPMAKALRLAPSTRTDPKTAGRAAAAHHGPALVDFTKLR